MIASLDHVGQVTDKSCLGVLSHSVQGQVIFRVTKSACDYVMVTHLHTTGRTVQYNYYNLIVERDFILTYSVSYGSVKLAELEEPLILSVVLRE